MLNSLSTAFEPFLYWLFVMRFDDKPWASV